MSQAADDGRPVGAGLVGAGEGWMVGVFGGGHLVVNSVVAWVVDWSWWWWWWG